MIFLFATGGVSHIDTFDPKPETGKGKNRGSMWGYSANKRCGTVVSDLFPQVRECMDDVCLIRSMKSAHFDHSEAALGIHTGSATFTRPSMGSWLSYGLGTFNKNLPSFVVIAPELPYGGTQVYASDFLPAHHQGTRVIPGATPIANLRSRSPMPGAGGGTRPHGGVQPRPPPTARGDSALAAREGVRDGVPHAAGGARGV